MTATASSTGDVSIMVYFKQGADPDMATVNVQNRVSQAQALLPADVTQVGVTVSKMQNSILQIAGLKSTDGKYDDNFISNYIDINVKPRIMRITGVGEVQNLGNTYALRVWMKPDVMAQYGLTPDDISSAISTQSFVSSTGTLGQQSENAYQYPMEYKGTLKSIEEFENIVLRTGESGNLLYLKDVADVEGELYKYGLGVRAFKDWRRRYAFRGDSINRTHRLTADAGVAQSLSTNVLADVGANRYDARRLDIGQLRFDLGNLSIPADTIYGNACVDLSTHQIQSDGLHVRSRALGASADLQATEMNLATMQVRAVADAEYQGSQAHLQATINGTSSV